LLIKNFRASSTLNDGFQSKINNQQSTIPAPPSAILIKE
jgi:hypothetical protein